MGEPSLCLHNMGDPLGAAQHVLRSLKPDGRWMIVEPYANERVEDNPNPVGSIFYSASTMICTPASLAQEVGLALGAQVGESRWREIILGAGFQSFRRAAETPFNRVSPSLNPQRQEHGADPKLCSPRDQSILLPRWNTPRQPGAIPVPVGRAAAARVAAALGDPSRHPCWSHFEPVQPSSTQG